MEISKLNVICFQEIMEVFTFSFSKFPQKSLEK